MAVKQHIAQPTATMSATAAATVPAFPTSLADIKDAFSNLTLSARDLLHVPLRFVAQFDHLVSEAPRRLLGISARAVGDGAMAEAAHVAAGEAAAGAVGWRQAFGEAFQLSNTRSYWGMLHYITSRWAFTTFSLVSANSVSRQQSGRSGLLVHTL
jgi:hypothetical protein